MSLDTQRRRSRGATKGKNTARIVKHTQGRLPVTVDGVYKAFVGDNASKLANLLGVLIRSKAPVEGISYWREVDQVIKDSIVQGIVDSFDIEGYGTNENLPGILNAKCQTLYSSWRSRASKHYEKIMAKGEDPHVNCYEQMKQTQWEYMITNVWNTDKFKKRSEINKKNRGHVSSTHTLGSKSFPSALHDISTKAKETEEQPLFSDFFKSSHQKKGEWIDPSLEEDYIDMKQMEENSLANGEPISPGELSKAVFKKKNYLKGLGPNAKVSFKKKSNVGLVRSDEVQALNEEAIKNMSRGYEDKLAAQEAKIAMQEDTIENLKQQVVETQNQVTNFMKMVCSMSSIV